MSCTLAAMSFAIRRIDHFGALARERVAAFGELDMEQVGLGIGLECRIDHVTVALFSDVPRSCQPT